MPFHARIIDCGANLLVRALGKADAQDWHSLAEKTFEGLDDPCGLLIDLRPRENLPSADVARSIGRHFDARRYKAVALVARKGAQFGLARMVDALVVDASDRVRTFWEPQPAREWLLLQTEASSGET